MEKYNQFRDRGSSIAPFFHHPPAPSSFIWWGVVHPMYFLFRLPFFLFFVVTYIVIFHPILSVLAALFPLLRPILLVARKVLLWAIMGVAGIWWVDLKLDGVRRGTLAEQPPGRFPLPRSIIASSFTSPIDAVYLAAVFDPVFTVSYPGTRLVRRIGLLQAVSLALMAPQLTPPKDVKLTDLATLIEEHPDRTVAVFPECTTTNGKGVLPFSPSLLTAPAGVLIFPVSIHYTHAEVTTPIAGEWRRFIWCLLSRTATYVHVRIAEPIINSSAEPYAHSNGASTAGDITYGPDGVEMLPAEQHLLDKVSEALARLGRCRRVGLTQRDKVAFMNAWKKKKR